MPDPEPVAGVVLAAGRSRRMGRNKLLLDAGGEPIIRRIVGRAIDAGLDPVVVVMGFESERLVASLEGLRHTAVHNPAFDAGVNGSVRGGLSAVPDASAAAVVLLGDMPFVTSDMIRALVTRYREADAPLVVSTYGGIQAPPTLYARVLFDAFRESAGEGLGKRVVEQHRAVAAVVEWPRDALADIDSPEDYTRLVRRFSPTGR